MSKDLEKSFQAALLEAQEEKALAQDAGVEERQKFTQMVMGKKDELLLRVDELEKTLLGTLRPLLEAVNNVGVKGEGEISIIKPYWIDEGIDHLGVRVKGESTGQRKRRDRPDKNGFKPRPTDELIIDKIAHENFSITLELEWNKSKSSKYYDGDNLLVSLFENNSVEIIGGSKPGCDKTISPKIRFNLEDENWQEKFERGIAEILTTDRATRCSRPIIYEDVG